MNGEKLYQKVQLYFHSYGQRKEMGVSAIDLNQPHFFLHREFAGDQDLLIIFNTKRCQYQCYFCQLPAKSSKKFIDSNHILSQFGYVVEELKHSISVLTRITLSNEGSILDASTFPRDALLTIGKCINELKRVNQVVIETRLEFVDSAFLELFANECPRCEITILTGFETLNADIRDNILFKKESINMFLTGLDNVGKSNSKLCTYLLYKPSPYLTDEQAYAEAKASVYFLREECGKRNIEFSVRVNPMYAAENSRWRKLAESENSYLPPRLTDAMKFAEEIQGLGIDTYIGLSTEGLNTDGNNYMAREDYSPNLIKPIKMFNEGIISAFGQLI